MKRVVIESPFAGDVAENIAYARRCVRDCLARNESPYASHLFFTQEGLLDDTVPEERALGIDAGLTWGATADLVAVYVDRGLSKGMFQGILAHRRRGVPIVCRSLNATKDLNANEYLCTCGKDTACVIHATWLLRDDLLLASWGDTPLPEDQAIDATFPTRSGRHDLYDEARRLVGARHSKGGLIALVNWLLHRVEAAECGAASTKERPVYERPEVASDALVTKPGVPECGAARRSTKEQ